MHAPPTGQTYRWLDRQILLSFYTGGVSHHCHDWEIGALKVSVFYPFALSWLSFRWILWKPVSREAELVQLGEQRETVDRLDLRWGQAERGGWGVVERETVEGRGRSVEVGLFGWLVYGRMKEGWFGCRWRRNWSQWGYSACGEDNWEGEGLACGCFRWGRGRLARLKGEETENQKPP